MNHREKNKNFIKRKEPLTYIELFAGAGGLAEGFINAGFTPVAYIEMDRNAALTLKTRVTYHYLKGTGNQDTYLLYLKRKISRENLYITVMFAYLDTLTLILMEKSL